MKKLIDIKKKLSDEVQRYADKHYGGNWTEAARQILGEKMLEEKQKVFQEWAEDL